MTRDYSMTSETRTEWWRPDAAIKTSAEWGRITPAELKAPDSAVPFWALMTFTFILLFAPQSYFPALEPFRIAMLAAVVAIAAHLYGRSIRGQPLTIRTREMGITACLAGWAVLTIPFSYWRGGSLSFLLQNYFKTLAIFWLLSNTVNTVGRLKQVAWGLSLMGVGLAAMAVDHFRSGTFMAEGEFVPRVLGNEAGLTSNPNDLALMLNLILPLSVALCLMNRKPKVRTLLLVAILLEATAVILTYSRAGFLTLATTIAMYLWKSRSRPERRWLWAALVVALLAIPFLPSSYFDRVSTIAHISADQTGSAQARWRDTFVALDLVLKSPIIGAGVGMNILALNEERGEAWKAVHNVYLEYAVDLGIPGLVLFLLLLVGCMKNAGFIQQRTARQPAFRELFYLAQGIQISLIAFAVAAPFHPVAYHFYFYYIAGLAVAVKAVHEAVERHDARDQHESTSQ